LSSSRGTIRALGSIVFFIGSFFNTFLPGLVGGDAIKAFYLYKHSGISLASVFMDRYIGFTTIMGRLTGER